MNAATDLIRYEIRAEDMFGNPQIVYRDDLDAAMRLAQRAVDNDAAYVSVTDNQTGTVVHEIDCM